MKRFFFLLLFPFALVSQSYYGDAPKEIKASLKHEKKANRLDQVGQLKLNIEYPKDYSREELNEDRSTKTPQFHLAFDRSVNPSNSNETQNETIVIEYEPIEEGLHVLDLPILNFQSKSEPHKRHTLYPPSIECEIQMIQEDPMSELEIAAPLSLDPKPNLEVDHANRKVFFQNSEKEFQKVRSQFLKKAPSMKWKWFVLAFVLGLVVFKAYQLLTKQKNLQNLFTPSETPRERALRALNQLKQKKLPQKGQYDAFYVEITQIVRKYIEGHYHVNAPEQTTQEFLQVVLGQSLFNEQINHYLTEFLKFADLVKFARLNPNIEDCHQAEEAAQSFILSESDN